MGINRVSASTDQIIHAGGTPPCLGAINLKPWIPKGANATAASVVRHGVCDRCGKAFFDPGDLNVADDDLEAGQSA